MDYLRKSIKIYFSFWIHQMHVLLVYPVLNATVTNILPFRKITQMEHPLSNVTELHSTAVSRMPMYANSRWTYAVNLVISQSLCGAVAHCCLSVQLFEILNSKRLWFAEVNIKIVYLNISDVECAMFWIKKTFGWLRKFTKNSYWFINLIKNIFFLRIRIFCWWNVNSSLSTILTSEVVQPLMPLR